MRRNLKQKPGSKVREYKSYRAMPWRNGRGSTLEIAREPPRGESFAWRLSLADIDQDGEFSSYPGYHRALILVAGKSLRLKFRGHGNCFLEPARRGIRFEGDWKADCAVLQGRCTDLSLIVRRGPTSVIRMPRMLQLKSTARVVLAGDLYSALFILEGSMSFSDSITARSRTLRARDTLLVTPGAQRALRLHSTGQSAVQVVLLRWRPGHLPATRD